MDVFPCEVVGVFAHVRADPGSRLRTRKTHARQRRSRVEFIFDPAKRDGAFDVEQVPDAQNGGAGEAGRHDLSRAIRASILAKRLQAGP